MRSDLNMLSPAAGESWRAWLLTGARRHPVDRRRIRGAHLGLKRMMVEGMQTGGEHPYTWKEFSDAMVRHAVGDAVGTLSPADEQLIKLAYFGGCTNEQLAMALGVTEATVKKRLKRAMEEISRYVQRGTRLGRRAACAIAAVFTGRWLHDAGPSMARLGTVVAVAVLVGGSSPGHVQPPFAPLRPGPGQSGPVVSGAAGDVVVRHAGSSSPVAGNGPAVPGPSTGSSPWARLSGVTVPLAVPALPVAVMPAPLPSPLPVPPASPGPLPVSGATVLQAPSSL